MSEEVTFNKMGLKIAIWFVILVCLIVGTAFGFIVRNITLDREEIYENILEVRGQNCTNVYPYSYDIDFPREYMPRGFKEDVFDRNYSRIIVCSHYEITIPQRISI